MVFYDRDVFPLAGGVAFAGLEFDNQRVVKLFMDGVTLRTYKPAPTRTTCLRGAGSPDQRVCLVAIKGTDTPGESDLLMYALDDGEWVVTDVPAANPRAVAVWWNGAAFIVVVQISRDQYRTGPVGNLGPPLPIPPEHQGTAGILQVVDGEIIWRQDPAGGYRRVTINGITYTNFVSANGVLIGQANNRTEGVIISEGKRFLVSNIEGEDIRIAYADGIWLMTAWAQGEQEFTRPAPPFDAIEEVEEAPPTYATLPRKIWFAPYYQFSNIYGDTDDVIGNAGFTWEAGVAARMAARGMPLILGKDAFEPSLTDLTVAFYIERARPRDAEEEYRTLLTTFPEKPIILYCDEKDQLLEDGCPEWIDKNRTWLGVHTYRNVGEGLGVYENRIRRVLDEVTSVWGVPLMLAPQYFDRNLGPTQIPPTLDMKGVEDRLYRDYQVVAIMPFSDRRGDAVIGGMTRYPILREWCKALYRAVPARPSRFDYWQPAGTDLRTLLRNKLMQDAPNYNLSKVERDFLLELMRGGGDPPPPEIPDLSNVVVEQFNQHPDLVEANTRESCGKLTEFIARALSARDSNFGLLSKQPGENQYNGHGVDAIAFGRTNTRVLDVIKGAGARGEWDGTGPQPPPAQPDWNEVERRPGNAWMAPI